MSCLKFVADFLDKIDSDDSPVATVLSMEAELENYKSQINFPEVILASDGTLGSEMTRTFVELYQVRFIKLLLLYDGLILN